MNAKCTALIGLLAIAAHAQDRWEPRDTWEPRLAVGTFKAAGDRTAGTAMELLGKSAVNVELQLDRNWVRNLTTGFHLGFVDLDEDHQRYGHDDLFYVGAVQILKPSVYDSPVAPFLIASAGIAESVRDDSGDPLSDIKDDVNPEPGGDIGGGSSGNFKPYGGIGAGVGYKLSWLDLVLRGELWQRYYHIEGEYRRSNTVLINVGRGL